MKALPHSIIIMKIRSNATRYKDPIQNPERKAGRKRTYGDKIALREIFKDKNKYHKEKVEVYGKKREVQIYSTTFLSRIFEARMQYVFVILPGGRKAIFSCLDLDTKPTDIIKIYSYRFKIEEGYKSAIEACGAFDYQFWLSSLKPNKKGETRYLSEMTEKEAQKYDLKARCYEIYSQMAMIGQGILQICSMMYQESVNAIANQASSTTKWKKLRLPCSWFRTIRANRLPSEKRISLMWKDGVSQFLQVPDIEPNLKKFISSKLQKKTKKGDDDIFLKKIEWEEYFPDEKS